MPLIASRWPGRPQTMATRRSFSRWRKHGGSSPRRRKPERPVGTTRTADWNRGRRRGRRPARSTGGGTRLSVARNRPKSLAAYAAKSLPRRHLAHIVTSAAGGKDSDRDPVYNESFNDFNKMAEADLELGRRQRLESGRRDR